MRADGGRNGPSGGGTFSRGGIFWGDQFFERDGSMEQPLVSRFFLGANAPGGFSSLYGGFTDPDAETLYILKGGPGCGKSTMMKKIAAAAENAGLDVELIHCSGDPDSLDGVKIPARGVAYVDGTSPHVVEPSFAGAQGIYVNLGAFYDREALLPVREDIARLTRAYKAQYDRAFRLLAGAAALNETLAVPPEARESALRRVRSVLRRELRGAPQGDGAPARRFLSAWSCQGHVTLWDTVPALCQRVWVLDNDLGLGTLALEEAAQICRAQGLRAVACMDPMEPDKIEHLLVPEAGFALVTQTADHLCPLEPYRHLRLDAPAGKDLRTAAKRTRKLRAPLLEEALSALREAKALHDELEALYIPNTDFSGVDKLTRRHIRALLEGD